MAAVLPAPPVGAAAACPGACYALVTVDDRGRYRLASSRRRFTFATPRRRFDFQVRNAGEDPHDLTIRRASDGRVLGATGHVAPHGVGRLRLRLAPGTYVLYCSIGEGTPESHEARGMRDRIVVVRRRA